MVEILSQNSVFKKVYNALSGKKIVMRICSLCLIGMLAVGVSIVSVGITLGFKVNYAGAFIATVRNSAVFADAKDIAVKHIESTNADSAIKTPSFKMTLTVRDRLDSAFKLADAIIENTNDIVEASALRVNGKTVICAESAGLNSALETRRNLFNIASGDNKSYFTDEVKTEKGYYLKSEVASDEEVTAVVNGLTVKTVSTVSADCEIPFEKRTEKTGEELIGYSKVTTAGENGVIRKTESVELVNGEEIARTEISSEVVKQPVTQVTLVGTAKTTAGAAQRTAARSAGFICPLDCKFTISSYYGDGRGHKGIDLATSKGNGIYAAAAGTVVSSGYDGAYGYSVVIDHGNGYRTRYAHASALKVSKGAVVNQGDLIALVGSTGMSSGNHLHFEVILNGNRVNPVSYIGLD